MRTTRRVILALTFSIVLVLSLACGDEDSGSPSPSALLVATATPSAQAAVASSSNSSGGGETGNAPTGSNLRQADLDEIVEAWLLAMDTLGEVFESLSNPLKAVGAVGKIQDVTSGMVKFAELDSLSEEDAAYIQEKYGGRIAEATKKFSNALEKAESSPLGGSISGVLGDFPMLGE